jgi:hypothetical protein
MSLNLDEYHWIRERVLEAEAAFATAKLNADHRALVERALTDLRSRRGAASDDGSRGLIDEQIAAFEEEASRVVREAARPETDAVRANMRILDPYRKRIGALQSDLDRRISPGPAAPRMGP